MITISKGNAEDMADFHSQHVSRLPYSLEQFADALADWRIWRVFNNGERVATVVEKNGVGHVARYKKKRVGVRVMKGAIDALHIWKTEVTDQFPAGNALAKRLGFTPVKHEKGVTHYVRVLHD